MNAITSSGRKTSQTTLREPPFCFAAPKRPNGQIILHTRDELVEIIKARWEACNEPVEVRHESGEIVSDLINGLPRRRFA